ncbi:MAG TPA: RNA-binding protein [Clostridia bacterium]|nr:RNA-binding protein [Clostridia bacterium]
MTLEPELEPGQLVISVAGRDRGRAYLVAGYDNAKYGTFVYVVDGKYRPVQRPKRKNIKHLKATQLKAEEIGSRLETGNPVSNVEIRKKLADLLAIYREDS